MAKTYEDEDGVWRTIGGRRVFIRNGQSLSEAMKESGKFSNLYKSEKKSENKEEKEKPKNKAKESAEKYMAEHYDERKKQFENWLEESKKITGEDDTFKKATAGSNKLTADEEDILDYFGEDMGWDNPDRLENLKQQIDDMKNPGESLHQTAKRLAEGGTFLVANDDMEQWLKDRNIKVKNDDIFGTYSEEMANKIEDLYKSKAESKPKEPKATNWRDQVKANDEQLEKDLQAYKDKYGDQMGREEISDGYYELFRENERKNAKIKQELPDEKYEPLQAYATYKEKREKLEPRTEDGGWEDSTWTGKEYTNDEFMENLEDENWHSERQMLLDAGLTNKEMEFVKNHTSFHNGSPNLDKEIVEELIKGAKGEKFRTPEEIRTARTNERLSNLEESLGIIAKEGKYDDNGNLNKNLEGKLANSYRGFSEMKKEYEDLSGKEYKAELPEIPYDPKKTYELPNGVKIDQKLMQDWYSGENPEKVKRDIEFEKEQLYDVSPAKREVANAKIKEMEKYYDSMEKYESRISDEFTTEDWPEGYGSHYGSPSWKGSKSDSGLYGSEKLKAIDDEIKKAYPEIKTSRRTHRGGYTDSFTIDVMSSSEPIIRDINSFSDTELNRLWNKGYNKNYYNNFEDFKKSVSDELSRGHFEVNSYNIDDDYRLTPYGKQLFKDMARVSDAYNYDESDSMSDYFHTGHYMTFGVGKGDKPFELTSKTNATMNKAIKDGAKKKLVSSKEYNDNLIGMYNEAKTGKVSSQEYLDKATAYMDSHTTPKIEAGQAKAKKQELWEKQADGSYKANKEAMKQDYEERHKNYDAKIKQLANDRVNMPNTDWEASVMAYEKQNADGTYKTMQDIMDDVEEYTNKNMTYSKSQAQAMGVTNSDIELSNKLHSGNSGGQVKVKGDSNVIPRDFEKGYGKFKVETSASKNLDDRFEITKDEYGYHAKNLRTGETFATFGDHLRNNNVFEFENTSKPKTTNETMNQAIREKASKTTATAPTSERYSGTIAYLKETGLTTAQINEIIKRLEKDNKK